MRVTRLDMTEDFGVEVDILPAVPEFNPLFNAAATACIKPLSLSAHLGRLSEEVAQEALARAYAEGVIVGSPTPELEHLDREGWYQWLLQHPDEFAIIRSIAEVKRNFDPDAEDTQNAQRSSDTPPEQGGEPSH